MTRTYSYAKIITREVLEKHRYTMAKEVARLLNEEHGTNIKATSIRDYRSKLGLPYLQPEQKEMVVVDKKEPEELLNVTVKEYFEKLSKIQGTIIKMQDSVTVHVPEPDKYLVVAVFGDLHFGIDIQDVESLERDTELVMATENCIAIQVGDILDNGDLKGGSNRQYRVVLPREACIDIAVKWFESLGNKMAAFVTGNHDKWLINQANIDIGNSIVDKIKGAYLGPNGVITLAFQQYSDDDVLEYRIYLRHNTLGNSMYNDLHTGSRSRIKKPFLDAVCFGHIHAGAAINEVPTGDFLRGVSVRSAGYWKDVDTYYFDREVREFKQLSLTPAMVFSPRYRKVLAFSDLRDAIIYQKAMNEKLIAGDD